jgi:hypothetical protein
MHQLHACLYIARTGERFSITKKRDRNVARECAN